MARMERTQSVHDQLILAAQPLPPAQRGHRAKALVLFRLLVIDPRLFRSRDRDVTRHLPHRHQCLSCGHWSLSLPIHAQCTKNGLAPASPFFFSRVDGGQRHH